MSETVLIILSVLLAAVIVIVLAGALVRILHSARALRKVAVGK